jgi:lactate dehydrogenase-like 2-hydroxyacid dehydrogenase
MGRQQPKVLITRPIQKEAIDRISRHCEIFVYPVDEPMPAELLAEAMNDVSGMMSSGVQIGEDLIADATKLRIIANLGVGYDNIDVEACSRRCVMVTNTPDVLSEATADLGFALILGAARRIAEGDRYVRELKWTHWQWNFMLGAEVHGRTLGLYGLGRIGKAVARRARGFSMRTLYHSRHRIPERIEAELGAEFVDRETLFRQSDFLSLHVPLTSETRHSVRTPELAMMKPSAFIINTARGSIIDETALVEALQTRRIAGAGLDVFEHEPKIHPALLAMKNVVLMPHVGSATAETRLRMAFLAADNLLAALHGRRPPNLVNPEALE